MNTLIDKMTLTTTAAQAKRDKLAQLLQWGLIAGVALVAAPLAFMLLAAITALVLSGLIGMAAVAFAPVASMKFANWRLSLILAEAQARPVETLENELLHRKAALRKAREQLQTGLALVEGFVVDADKAALQYPEAADRWRERASRARALADARSHHYLHAMQAVEAFEREVERSRTEWKLALAEAAMNDSINATLGDPLSALGTRTAIEAIANRMNEAFAGLEIALLEGQAIDRR